MIIKKFLNNINISIYTIILIFLALLTGLIKEIIVISSLIIIHEFGHYYFMNKYNWQVSKINIYPFGGITHLNEKIDMSLKEEFIITIMGPLFQEIFYIIIFILHKNYIINNYIYNLYKNYNFTILICKLLPMIPLDGSKIFNILLNKIFNFRLSYIINLYISVICLIFFLFFIKDDTSYYLIIVFLIYQVIFHIKNRYVLFNRFILEKKLNKSKYIKYKKINDIKKMYRNKKNLIKLDGSYITEYKYINKK